MSRRFEFLEEGAEVVTGALVKDEKWFDSVDGIADDDLVLVLGQRMSSFIPGRGRNPYASASVLLGSKEYLVEVLQGWIDQINEA